VRRAESPDLSDRLDKQVATADAGAGGRPVATSGEEAGMASNSAGTSASAGAIYGLGIFGAWVYFWQQADTFWEYVLVLFQGIFWPAFMVYDAFAALAS
jgi:hypothetical protein